MDTAGMNSDDKVHADRNTAAQACAPWLVWRLLRGGVGRWTAFAAAIWFAVHPVHVEAIASVANSSEALVTIFTAVLALVLRRIQERTAPGASIGWPAAVG